MFVHILVQFAAVVNIFNGKFDDLIRSDVDATDNTSTTMTALASELAQSIIAALHVFMFILIDSVQ